MALTIERVAWGALRPHPNNPRATDTALIRESVNLNGVYRPVIVAQDGTILAGHHLWAALGELGHTEVDVVRLPLDPRAPEALRVMLVDNRSADVGGYDEGVLLNVLSEVDDGVGLLGTGYRDTDLETLREWLNSEQSLVDVLDGAEWERLNRETTTLSISGLSTSDIAAFRASPGSSDAERMRALLGLS